MNSFHNFLNNNYNNEINEYTKRNVSKIVPTYSLKNTGISKECDNLGVGRSNKITHITDGIIKSFKENENIYQLNDVNNFVDISNKYSSIPTYRRSLNNVSIKNNSCSSNSRILNNLYVGSIKYKNNSCQLNTQKTRLRNTTENEKNHFKEKQNISKDYATKEQTNLKSQIGKDNLLYYDKKNKILYRNNSENKKDNSILEIYKEAPFIRSDSKNANLNNYKFMQKIKMEKSLSSFCEENKKVNLFNEVNMKYLINKKGENNIARIPLSELRKSDKIINFNSNNSSAYEIKYPNNLMSNGLFIKNMCLKEPVLNKRSGTYSKRENKNLLMRTNSHIIFNDHNLINLKNLEKKHNSINYFNKNNNEKKDISENVSKIDNEQNLVQIRIKNNNSVENTKMCKTPNISMKNNIKSELYMNKPINVNQNIYMNNYSDMNSLQNNKYLTNSMKSDIISNNITNQYYNNSRNNCYRNSFKDSDNYNNGINNYNNNNHIKILPNETKSDEKRCIGTFKKCNVENSNNFYERENMPKIIKNSSNNSILKILNKEEIANTSNNLSLYQLNEKEEEKKKGKINLNCIIQNFEHKNNKKEMYGDKPCSDILLNRTEGAKYDLLNHNMYYYEFEEEEKHKLMNKEIMENVRHKRNYCMGNRNPSQNLNKNCYKTLNETNNIINKNKYCGSTNYFEQGKDTYDIKSYNNTSKFDEMPILNNEKKKKNYNFNANVISNIIYRKLNDVNNKYIYQKYVPDEEKSIFSNSYNHKYDNDKHKKEKIYSNEISKLNTEKDNCIVGNNDFHIYDYIHYNSTCDKKSCDKRIIYYNGNNEINGKSYKDCTKRYNSDTMFTSDIDNNKSNEEHIMLNKIFKNRNTTKNTSNGIIHENNAMNYEECKREHNGYNCNNYYKKSTKDIDLKSHDKKNVIILSMKNDLKEINDYDSFNKKVEGNFYYYDKDDNDLIKTTKRQISCNKKKENYSKESLHAKEYDHYNQNLDNAINVHKTINQEKEKKEGEMQEVQENEKNEKNKKNEKSGKKIKSYIIDVKSNDKNGFIMKNENTLKKANENKNYVTIIEENNINNEKLINERDKLLVEETTKNGMKNLVKDEYIIMLNKSKYEKKNKIDNDSHDTNKNHSNESFYYYNKKVKEIDNIKECSYKSVTEIKQKHISKSNPSYILKNSKNTVNVNDENKNIKRDDNNELLIEKNNTIIKCKQKVNSNNISCNQKNIWETLSNENITDLEHEITSAEVLTDSYIYHLKNINKLSKQRIKKIKIKNCKVGSNVNEGDILYMRQNKNNELKKKYIMKKGRNTDRNQRKEDVKKYLNDNKNLNINPSNKIREKRSKSVASNKKSINTFNKRLIMLESEKINNIKSNTVFKEVASQENKNEINECFEGIMMDNKENDIFSTEKNNLKKYNYLSVSRIRDTNNDSINNDVNMKNNIEINDVNTNFDNITNNIKNCTTIIHNNNSQNYLSNNNEKIPNNNNDTIDDLHPKTDNKKEKKVILPWQKDNIVKLNIKNKSKKKKTITINTKLARYERVLIHTCINKLNWKKCTENMNKGTFYWIGHNINDIDHYNYMKKKKIINRIPSLYMYTKKKALTYLLSHLSLIYPSLYDFYPSTFVLPENKNIIKYVLNSNNKDYYIMKPDSGSMGIGVKLIHKYSDININILNGYNCYIIQKYIDNPLLMYKKKFDFRIYILLLPGKNYPKIYLSKVGFARLCTEEYKKKKRYICNTYVHLTNYSINKDNEKYIRKKNIHDKNNNKQLLSDVFIYLKNNNYDIDDIWKQIKKISCLTSLAIYYYIKSKIKYNFKNNFYFYQLIGLDILLDHTGKAWLLEVNSNPSLRIDYLDPNYTYFEIQLESMFDRYVKEPVISEMFLIVYKKIYKKYLKKRNKKSICMNKSEKTEKHNVKCDNKIKSSKTIIQGKPFNSSFYMKNLKLKKAIDHKKYPEDESITINKKNSYSLVDVNKVTKKNSYILNNSLNKNKICANSTKNNIKKKCSSMLYNSGSDAVHNYKNNSLNSSNITNSGIDNLIKKKNKIKKSLYLKKENISNIDTCVDENDIGSFSLSNNMDTDDKERDNLLSHDKNEVSEQFSLKLCNTNNNNYEKKSFMENKKYDISLNEQSNFLKKRKGNIRKQKQYKGVRGEEESKEKNANNGILKLNNTNKEEKEKCSKNSDSSNNNNISSKKKNARRNYSNSDYSYDSYYNSVNFMGSDFINGFDDSYDNLMDNRDKNVSLNFPNVVTYPNNIDNEELNNSESHTYSHYSLKNGDPLLESNILNKETYVQIGNQEDIQLDKFLNNDVEAYKSIYRNISDSVYKQKIENLIRMRSNLYKYMNCLNVLGIRYINKDIGNLDDMYNKNVSFDLKKTYTKIRKDILHPLKNNILEKNVYINLKKETSKYYDEMKIYNNCYFLFDFVLKKYDNNLKKKSNKFEYYIDKNTFLCMCKDLKLNKIIENINIPTTTYNKFFEMNKNSNENQMYQIIKEVLKNKNTIKENNKENNKAYDENYSHNSNFLNKGELSKNNLSDENNCNDTKKKKEKKESSVPHGKNLKNADSLRNNQSTKETNANNQILNKNICSNSSYYSTIFCPFSFASTSNNLVNFNSIGANSMKYKNKRKKKMNVYDLEYLFTRQVFFSKYINKNQGLTLIDFFLLLQQLALLIFPYISYLNVYNSIYPYSSSIFEELNNQENNIFTISSNDKEINNTNKNLKNIKKIEKDQDLELKGKRENKSYMDKSTKDIKELQEKKRDKLNTRLNSEDKRIINYSSTTNNKQEEKKKDNYLWHKNICNNIYNLYEYIQISISPNVKNICLETFLIFIFNKYGISYFS